MEWVEASGRSLADAKEVVLDLLGVAEDDAEVLVLSEPKAGLFGRMRGEARVRARVRPVTPRPKRGRRQRSERVRSNGVSGDGGRRDGNRRSDGSSRRSSESRGEETGQKGKGSASSRAADGRAASRGNGKVRINEAEGGESAAKEGSSRRRRSRRPGRGQNSGTGPDFGPEERKEQRTQTTGRGSGDSGEAMEESLTLEEQGEAARGFVAGLVQEFGMDADVGFTEIDDDTVLVSATGDDLGLLVGPRGATLSAVQDLTRTFVQRQSERRTDRILVDVGGYREKRAAALRRFTQGLVEEVRSSGEERALEPMSPADRKVVHDTVTEIEGVGTRSEGTEPSRYVVIEPSS